MKTKSADAEKHAQAVAEAVEKAKAAAPNPTTGEDLAKRHAGELKALEEKLTAEHKATLKTAVEEALKSQPEASQGDQKGAVDAAIAEVEAKTQARLQEEIASAVERGRMEQAAKNKLKDSQLVKAQKRVKELEAHIHEWQAAGIKLPQPSTTSVTPTTTTASAGSLAPIQQPQGPKAATVTPTSTGTSQPKPSPVAVAAASATAPSLPRRPPLGPSAASAARGGASLRGAGRGGITARGAAPLRQPPVKPAATAAASGGVSIIGAASKRPREDGTTSSEDSLAKRLKPADPS